ncbi:MAG TPA: DNA polymerase Y family protein [Rhodoferax sp.]|nr:DNA polymerase Y family protein [Rhodoferax sp.]
MHWIALLPPEEQRTAWGWWALHFTSRVAQADEALLLEVSAAQRLWGGGARLLQQFIQQNPFEATVEYAQGATSLVAIALLRLACCKLPAPPDLPGGLPLDTLSAALPHAETLARIGCRRWGEARALPRGGVARRFGAALLDALDTAWGERPESHAWLELPEVFDRKLELPALATGAPELLWSAAHLLSQLRVWLQARRRGVLAFELEWTLERKRQDRANLPGHASLIVRTARPAQDMAHLRRLLGEQLARITLAAPVSRLRLRSLETAPWAGMNTSLLPGDDIGHAHGESLNELVERLGARLGADRVLVPVACCDHRPERMQQWVPAHLAPGPERAPRQPPLAADALYPTWLLPEPRLLPVRNGVPHYGGPLRRLARGYRVEAGWWEEHGAARRDYFIARSERAGLVWIYREQPSLPQLEGTAAPQEFRWYLQGLYA